jgi:hypothetical protein
MKIGITEIGWADVAQETVYSGVTWRPFWLESQRIRDEQRPWVHVTEAKNLQCLAAGHVTHPEGEAPAYVKDNTYMTSSRPPSGQPGLPVSSLVTDKYLFQKNSFHQNLDY